MSLKAKIEAVIYASEEPVTLAQLVGLLGMEAQAELDELAARQQQLDLPGESPEELGDLPAAGEAELVLTGDSAPLESVDTPLPDGAAEAAAEKRAARDRERRLREYLGEIVAQLIADFATSDRGLEVREVAGGYRMATKPEYHDAVRGFVRSLKPPLKLTLQALETLAVVAYKQPVTAPEISEIRGVDSGGVLGSLIARKLVTTAGRKQVIGRPILYKTTKDFLLRFGLKDLAELPSIEEFEKMASELAEQEEIAMPEMEESTTEQAEERITHENLVEEQHAVEPQADADSDSLDTVDTNRGEDELPAVDGRISGLPPTYDRPGDDPSADEAAIQGFDSREADAPEVVGTPEGDNEFAPDEPLKPMPEGETGLQEPLGSAPDPYKGE
jgi:segregation and condensation protein B